MAQPEPNRPSGAASRRRRRVFRRARCLALVLAAVVAAPGALAGYPDASPHPSLFGFREVRSETLSLFPKWLGAVARHFQQARASQAPCREMDLGPCRLRAWKAFLAGLQGVGRMAQIRAVNRYLNQRRYIIDPRNYGVPDYWAAPGQFLALDGDCEDYAIAKYFSLRALGFPPDSLRIVVLQDLNLDVAHAILVVYLDGRALVLDNQAPTVVDARAISHYRPIYSINERHWWLHRL